MYTDKMSARKMIKLKRDYEARELERKNKDRRKKKKQISVINGVLIINWN